MSDFQLDPEWEHRLAGCHRPLPPQPILCDGVVVGHRDDETNEVRALHGDPALQPVLERWWRVERERIRQKREAETEAFFEQNRKRQATEAKAARRAVLGSSAD